MDKTQHTICLASLGSGVFGGMEGAGGRRHYGGAQSWFGHGWQRDSCCGTVAAANITAYLAAKGGEYSPLYSQKDMDEKSFLAHQHVLLQYVKPFRLKLPLKGIIGLGIWSAGRLRRGVKRYARERGVQLRAVVVHKWRHSKAKALDMIYTALSEDRPVAMLVHFNRQLKAHESGKSFARHWVTITGLRTREGGQAPLATVSSWNREYTLDLDTAWDKSTYISFIYFI